MCYVLSVASFAFIACHSTYASNTNQLQNQSRPMNSRAPLHRQWFPYLHQDTLLGAQAVASSDYFEHEVRPLLDVDQCHPFDLHAINREFRNLSELVHSFQLHSDFDLRQVKEFCTFQSSSRSLSSDDMLRLSMQLPHYRLTGNISRFDLIENKLASRRIILNQNHDGPADAPKIAIMERIVSITDTKPGGPQFPADVDWSALTEDQRDEVVEYIYARVRQSNDTEFILKPAHLDASTGVCGLSSFISDDDSDADNIANLKLVLQSTLRRYEKDAALTSHVPAAAPGAVIEVLYSGMEDDRGSSVLFQQPAEVRMYLVWGRLHYAVIKTQASWTPVVLTKDMRYLFAENMAKVQRVKKALDRYLPQHRWLEMIRAAEFTAQRLGCFGLRMDFFIGSDQQGFEWVWNEFAFPNEMEYRDRMIVALSQSRRNIIQQGFKIMGDRPKLTSSRK